MSSNTAMAAYLLTKEAVIGPQLTQQEQEAAAANTRKAECAGLLAAAFIAIVPGYISRSVAGSYDNEGVAIFALVFTYFLWLKAVNTGSMLWATCCTLSYFYMVSAWGGYVFIVNLIPLHVLVLLVMQRYTHRLYTAYCTFYVLGTVLAMQIPFVGFQPVYSSEHMAAFGVFGLLQVYVFVRWLRSVLEEKQFNQLLEVVLVTLATSVCLALVVSTLTGYVAPWTGRFYSLFDPTFAKKNIPIIASVSEHQPTSWSSYFFDLHVMVFFMPAGLYYCCKSPNEGKIFLLCYGVTSVYFSGVMVRLMLVLAPVACFLSAIAVAELLSK